MNSDETCFSQLAFIGQVTIPVEQHGEGSAPSDTEEEDFDRDRQHSVLPHKAGDQPFRSKVLTHDDEGDEKCYDEYEVTCMAMPLFISQAYFLHLCIHMQPLEFMSLRSSQHA